MKILSTRLTNWATRNSVIDEAQAGFRRGYSTVDNIFSLQVMIQKYTSKQKGRVYVLYIDFFKAFDSCVHTELWQSLQRKGIGTNNKLLLVFKSLYSQIRSCVKIRSGRSSHLTDFFECTIGTKQGCVSSTIIFNFFINDQCTLLKIHAKGGVFVSEDTGTINSLLFADDVATIADTVTHLQNSVKSGSSKGRQSRQ